MIDQAMQWALERAWIFEVFGAVLATAVVHFLARLLMRRLGRHLNATRNAYDDALLEAARGPLGWAIWVVGISWAVTFVGADEQAEIFGYVGPAREIVVIWLLVWFGVRFIRLVEEHLSDPAYRQKPVDRTTAAAVGKLLRASVVITGVLMALQDLGFSISGVLAFGGIGGIAVGFAARDMLANFFGALMIFLDRPIAVGDWVRSPDREIEGTVEDIGWRLTRIRTFDQRPLYVPNSVFTSIAVENPSRMLNRRIYETVGVRYDDIAALPGIVEAIRQMLVDHPDIDQGRTQIVNFVSFGASSLDIMLYAFTRTVVWTEYHAVKQDVLLRVAAIVAEHGAEIAFPTRTVHLLPETAAPEETDGALAERSA